MSRNEAQAYGWSAPRNSAVGTFFKSIAAVAITVILCVTGIAVVTVSMANHRIGSVLDFAEDAIENLPLALQQAAPILADAVNDRRDPGYVRSIKASATIGEETEDTRRRAIIEITNSGDEVISILAMRAVYLDQKGHVLNENVVYGATPLAVEDEWRGPLLPGVTRKLVTRCPREADSVEVEIADVRLWDKDAPKSRTAETKLTRPVPQRREHSGDSDE